jgi:hypothetical protein
MASIRSRGKMLTIPGVPRHINSSQQGVRRHDSPSSAQSGNWTCEVEASSEPNVARTRMIVVFRTCMMQEVRSKRRVRVRYSRAAETAEIRQGSTGIYT